MNFKEYLKNDETQENLGEARMSKYNEKDFKALLQEANKKLTELAIALDGKTYLDPKDEKAQYKKVKKFKDDLVAWSLTL